MAFYSDLFRSTTFLTGPVNLAEGATTISGSMGLIPLGQRNMFNPGGIIRAFNPSTLATNPAIRAVYDSRSISLVINGEVSGLGTWPAGGDLASFAPNPSIIISGSFLIENDGSTFNQLRGLTHIPGNNGLIIGGNLTSSPAISLGDVISNRDYRNAANIRNNITIFSSGMGEVTDPANGLPNWTSGFNSTAPFNYRGSESSPGTGINIWGFDRTNPGTNDRALRGVRFTMDDQFYDNIDYYGKTFQIQIGQHYPRAAESASFFSHRKSILQYSFKRGILTLGTVEPIGFGQTTIQASRDVTIVSGIQIGGYVPNITTGPSDSKILLAANNQIRFAGAIPVPGQSFVNTEVFLDNVLFFGSASSFPVLTRPDYALAIQTGSRASGDPNVYQVGLTALGGGGGGGGALPGGQNYDIQYNQNNNFGGASNRAQFFQYVYDAANTPLFLHRGRTVVGELTTATGRFSHAEGFDAAANASYSHAEGYSTAANGLYSHAEGERAGANGQAAHAEGLRTFAAADYSHAEGYFTTTNGPYSHTEGYLTNTRAIGAHAEGSSNIASGDFSHVEGSSSIASAAYSHAEGFGTLASGIGSHAEGIGTIAAGGNQHAEGRYNISSSTAIWVLGDGTSTIARHNLIEGHTGQVRFSGSLFVQPGQGYLPFASQSTVLTYNPSTGQIVLMNTSSIGVGGGGPQYWIQDGTRLYTSGGFNNIQVTGSFYASGSTHTLVGRTTVSGGLFIQPSSVRNVTYNPTLTNPSILAYNTTTGEVQRTSLAAVGALAAPPSWSIQFNRNGAFGGTQFFIYSESLNTVFAATQFNIGLNNRVNSGSYAVVMGSSSLASGTGSFAQGLRVTTSGVYSHAEGFLTLATGSYSHAEGDSTIASGSYSHAEGSQTLASGLGAHAEGQLAIASGDYSHAEGFLTLATGSYSHAEGYTTIASSSHSHAEGYNTRALGEGTHAEGYTTIASGTGSHAEGRQTRARGNYSHAEGMGTFALGEASHAEGTGTIASGSYSHAEGHSTVASGSYSHAEGLATLALGDSSHAEGWLTTASGNWSHAEGVGSIASGNFSHTEGTGTFASGHGSHAEGFQTTASGQFSHTEGYTTYTLANYAHAEGIFTRAAAQAAHAEGVYTTASGDYSHAEGVGTLASADGAHAEGWYTLASGRYSHAEGREVTASGDNSHAEGYSTQALFQYSHAEGYATIASGSFAHAEGNETRALEDGAHAEGYFTLASGLYSHAEGRQTTASGRESHAQGRQTQAIGDWSFAGGYRTVASADYQSVLGRYNIPVQDEQTVLLVGGGFSGQNKNIILLQTASMQLTGSLYIQDSTWPISGEVYLPRASQSLMLVYNSDTGQVQLMHTSSLIPTERDPIFTSRSASLATTGSNIFRGNQTISGSIFVSQSGFPFATQSGLIVYNPITGQLQQMLTSSLIPTERDPIFTSRSASLATTGSNIFTDKQILSGALYIRPTDIPLASGSQVVTYDPLTGQFNRMLTSSLFNKDGYWIQDGTRLYTSGGFSTVEITGSLFVSSSAGGYGNFNTLQRSSTTRGINTIINSTFISSSNEDAPGLYIWQSNTRARSLQAEGGVGVWFSASSGTQIDHYIQGITGFTPGIRGAERDSRITFLSGSVELGMVQRRVTETSVGLIVATGSNSIVHAKSTYALTGRTIHFPGSQSVSYGSTFTVVVQNAITGQGTGTTNFACANALVEDPTVDVFQFGYLLEDVPRGVYKYVYLNMSGSGNAWVCESARFGL